MATNGRIKANVRIVPVEAGDMDIASPWIYKAFQGDHVNDMMYPARKRDPKMTDEQRHKYVARSYEKRRESAQQGKCEYLKAVDVETGAILGVAEWVKPGTPIRDAKTEVEKAEKGEGKEEDNPEMDYDYMNRFMGTLCDTREKYMGEKPHWFLSILLVDPKAQGRGVGGKLLAWGMREADEADPPLPVYLEASPAGQPIYAAKGFKVVAEAPMHDKDEQGNITSTYSLPCMLRPPRKTSTV